MPGASKTVKTETKESPESPTNVDCRGCPRHCWEVLHVSQVVGRIAAQLILVSNIRGRGGSVSFAKPPSAGPWSKVCCI